MAVLIHNKKANFNYEILERFEAGLELLGSEVKSIRSAQGSLDGAYVTVRGGEVWLVGMHIPPYQPNNEKNIDADRMRRLLLTKDEIEKLAHIEKGLTIVPISVYNKGHKLKIEIASVKGKKKFDKRETIKKRDTERDIKREFRDR